MVFKFGEHYYTGDISTFWETLFITILGSLIGVLGALLIFGLTIKKDKKKDEIKEENYLKDRIRYLIILVEDVLQNSKHQIDEYEILSRKIKIDPINIHLPKIVATNQLERLKSIDSIDIFKGTMFLLDNTDDTIKQYSDFLKWLDFLDLKLKQIYNSNEKSILTCESYQNRFKELSDSIPTELRRLDKENLGLINHYVQLYNKKVEESPLNIADFNESFLKPLIVELQDIQNPRDAFDLVRKTTVLLDHWRINTLCFAEKELDTLGPDLDPVLDKLNMFVGLLKSKLERAI